MARDIAEGYYLATERSFRRMEKPQLDSINFEFERKLRGIRADQPSAEDLQAVQQRQRKMQRIKSAQMILRSYRMKARK